MIIEKIEITRQNLALQGELNFVDNDLLKDDCEKMLGNLVKWKLGTLKPIRHFEMVYNDVKHQAEMDVYVTVSLKESDASHINNIEFIFRRLMEFISLYEKEFKNINKP